MNTLLHKSFTNSETIIKDVDRKKGIIAGYFSAFGNVDLHNDIMAKGCYAKSCMENGPKGKGRIAHLWSHSAYEPIGKLETLEEDDYGLYFVSQLVNSQKGKDVLAYYEAGIINEHSVGFQGVKWKYDDDQEDKPSWERVRTFTEVKLYEGSSVVFGANPETPTTAVKGESPEEVKNVLTRLEKIEKLLRNGSTLSDEAFIQLEIECSQIREKISSLLPEEPQKHLEGNEPNLLEDWAEIKLQIGL